MKRILLIEDDPHIRLGLVDAFEAEGYEVAACAEGFHALAKVRDMQPSLVILDIMLPGKNGFDICKELRSSKQTVPILMLTAKSQEVDKVVGLELGADDYVTKPFGLRELLARVQALLRRAHGREEGFEYPQSISFGDVQIQTAALRGKRGIVAFELTPRELSVLATLYRNRGNAVSRDRILSEVWGQDYLGTTRTLDQVIVKLRQKIEPTPSSPRHILTVHGLGYRLEV